MKLTIDLHTHSIASGHAYSTVRELAEAAAAKGLEAIALTDHGPAMPGGPHRSYFRNLRSLPDYIAGVRILRGVEANILGEDGRLDLPDETLATLDFVAAGFHPEAGFTGGTVCQNTRALIAAMRNPYVDMIAHPCDLRYPVDMAQISVVARVTGTIMELNDRSFSPALTTVRDSRDACLNLAKLAKTQGIRLAANSDAHFDSEVGSVRYLEELAAEAGLTAREIVNIAPGRALAHLKARKNQLTSASRAG